MSFCRSSRRRRSRGRVSASCGAVSRCRCATSTGRRAVGCRRRACRRVCWSSLDLRQCQRRNDWITSAIETEGLRCSRRFDRQRHVNRGRVGDRRLDCAIRVLARLLHENGLAVELDVQARCEQVAGSHKVCRPLDRPGANDGDEIRATRRDAESYNARSVRCGDGNRVISRERQLRRVQVDINIGLRDDRKRKAVRASAGATGIDNASRNCGYRIISHLTPRLCFGNLSCYWPYAAPIFGDLAGDDWPGAHQDCCPYRRCKFFSRRRNAARALGSIIFCMLSIIIRSPARRRYQMLEPGVYRAAARNASDPKFVSSPLAS